MQELSQLQTVADNTNVILTMDNGREVNMDGIIEEVRQEYERIAQKGKDEVNAMYQGRVSRHIKSLPCLGLTDPETKMSILFSLPISTRTFRICG